MERLQSQNLADLPGVAHGFFTRKGGVSQAPFSSLNCAHGTGDDPSNVEENFRRIRLALGFKPGRLLKAHQVHGVEVAVAETPWSMKDRPKVDAIVTRVPGLGIGITTADCAPVLFADPYNKVVGCAHAGWKGALGGVVESVLSAMVALGAQIGFIHAAIGPCIQQQSYEVGAEFYERFADVLPSVGGGVSRFFLPSSRKGHFLFDLSGFVAKKIQKSGVQHVNLLARDTCFEEDSFFSYRRSALKGEKGYGCQLSVIGLRDDGVTG